MKGLDQMKDECVLVVVEVMIRLIMGKERAISYSERIRSNEG